MEEFVRESLNKLKYKTLDNEEIELPNIDLTNSEMKEYEEKFNKEQKKLFIYYSLQIMLGPVMESLVVLDRCLYLEQQSGVKTFILPAFNELISPRNLAIIAIKES